MELTDSDIKKGIYNSHLSNIFGNLSVLLLGNIFLTGYAILLDLTNYQIGLLTTFMLISNIATLISPYLVEKLNIRKKLVIISTIFSTIFFLPVLSLCFIGASEIRPSLLILFIALSGFFAAISLPVMTSWLIDLIPDNMKGKYFGNRGMIAGVTGVVFMLIAGKFIDLWHKDSPYGFLIVFSVGIIFNLIFVFFTSKIPEIKPKKQNVKIDILEMVKVPFANTDFLKFVNFRCSVVFSAVMVGAFMNVYLLRELKWNFGLVSLFNVICNMFVFLPQRWWGVVIDKIRYKPVIYVALILIGIYPLVLAITKSTYMCFIFGALCSIGWAALSMVDVKILFGIAKGEHSTSYMSVFIVLTSIFQSLSTLAGTILIDFFSFRVLFIVSLCLRIIAFLFAKTLKEPEKHEVTHEVTDVIRLFGQSVVNDIVIGFNNIVHYISFPIDSIKQKNNK